MKQLKSFTVEWDRYAERYSSWFREQPGEEDEYLLNDLLNYALLSCIPKSMEQAIYKDRSYTVDKVPTAEIMIDIKKIIVEEAVQCAQQTVVQQVDKDTEVEVEVEATPETVCKPVLLGAAWSYSSPSTWPGPGMPRSTGPSSKSSIGRRTK